LNPPALNGKYLLIDPILTRCSGVPAKAPYLWMPIGLAYTAAFAREHTSSRVRALDAQAEGLSETMAVEKASKSNVVFVNTGTSSINRDLRMCSAIKENNSDTKIALIGAHASFFHRELIENSAVDFVIRGEPEKPVAGLLNALEKGGLEGVRGLTWKENGKIVENKPGGFIGDLDSLPFPARDLFPQEKYYDILIRGEKPVLAISSRGCPFKCRFCASRMNYGEIYRARSPKSVLREVEEMGDFGKNDLLFFDDTFTVDSRRVEKICEGIKKTGLQWRCLSRVDTVNRGVLEKMYNAGCYQIMFGVESGSQRMLGVMNKGHSLKTVEKTFAHCSEIGIETVAHFVIGFPGETPQSIEKTISFAKHIKADFVTFNVFTPLPGSEVFEEFAQPNKAWEEYDLTSSSFCDMPSTEIQRAKSKAYREFYFRPAYLWNRVRKVGFKRTLDQNLKFWLLRRGVLWDSVMGRKRKTPVS